MKYCHFDAKARLPFKMAVGTMRVPLVSSVPSLYCPEVTSCHIRLSGADDVINVKELRGGGGRGVVFTDLGQRIPINTMKLSAGSYDFILLSC